MMQQHITNISCPCRAGGHLTRTTPNNTTLTMQPESCVSLARDTVIPTVEGWASLADIRPGKAVFDEQGNPCTITAVSEKGEEPVYHLSFDDGSSIEAGARHPWMTLTRGNRVGIVNGTHRHAQWKSNFLPYTTQELARSLTHRSGSQEHRMHSIPLAGALMLPERELLVDPYVLGMWLGDGTSAAAIVTCCKEDEPHYRSKMLAIGENWRILDPEGNTLHCSLAWGPHPRLRSRLRYLGVLQNKHIPQAYLLSSKVQRVALLHGLMDTDGHIDEAGNAEFVSTSQRLAEGTAEIVVSLGMKVTVTRSDAAAHRNQKSDVYRVRFCPTLCVASLPRKAERAMEIIEQRADKTLSKVKQRYIRSVENAGNRPAICISVNSESGMMLVGRQMLPVLTRGG